MGGTSYSFNAFSATRSAKAAAGIPVMSHAAAIASGAVAYGAHESLDPKKLNAAGLLIRESFDSDAHPDSRAVMVAIDGSGSMKDTPELLVDKLPKLMTTIIGEGWLPHPQICFSQICDTQDRIVLQLGQFEAGNEMDAALSNMACPGGGGGTMWSHEAYNLVLYAAAFLTNLDCVTKRQQKGYLFIIGDEKTYETLLASDIEKVFGKKGEKDYTLQELLKAAGEKFIIHWIIPSGTDYYNDKSMEAYHRALFGKNYHRLDDPAAICSCISGIIAYDEGFELDDITSKLSNIDDNPLVTKSATSALAVYAAASPSTLTKKTGSASEELVTADDEGSGSTRL